MKLAKLEMVGFKSFAEKTEFAFEPGVTALVGPNGCGKSNVVDAVRWILGEQRARVVRGSEMVDVIFNGTEKRRSMGYAEASLTILNTDRKLPVDYDEVCITRRIYRTGESEYLINGRQSRLRDVRALFTDTGVGMDTYSIIEQGKVDRLLQANASERRAVFEEAAGISGYKEQRRQAEAKLERTLQNLLRVNDIIQEKEKRLRSVKYQAAKARRHTEYMDRLRELAVALARRNYDELEVRVKAAQEQLNALETQRNALAVEVETIEKDVARLREQARLQQEACAANEAQIHLVDSQTSTCEERVRSGKLRALELDEAADAASRNVGSITEKISRAQADLQSAESELAVVEEGVRSQTEQVEQRAAAANEASRQATELEQRLEDRKAKIWDCLQNAAQVRNQMAQLTSKSQQDEARIARLTGRYAEAQKELAGLEEQRRKLAAEIVEAKAHMDEQSKAITACMDEARQLGEELARVSAEANQLRTSCTELRSRRNVLQEMEASASGLQQGVKRLLGRLEGSSPAANVRGMVAELIEVDLKHAAAIEAALGERAQSVVCSDTPSALTALRTLAEEKAGRASLLPLDRARALRPEAKEKAGEPGVVGAAVDLVRHGDDLALIVRALLGDVLVVQSMGDAVRMSQNGGRELRLVTLEGEIIEPGGAFSGGDPAMRDGVISRRSQLKDVERRFDEATADADKIEKQREELMQRLNASEERRHSCERELAAQRERRRDLESRQEIISSQEKRLRDELTVVKSETQEIEENVCSYTEQENRLKEQLLHLTRTQAELDAEIETGRNELRTRREHASQLAQEVTGLRVELAHKTEKRDSLTQRIGQLRNGIAENSVELETARGQIETYRKRRIEADEQVAESRQKILELRVSREQFEKGLVEAKALCDDTQKSLGGADESTHGLRKQLADLQQRHENLRIQEHEDSVRMTDLADRVRDEYETTLSELPGPTQERNWEEVQKEVTDLQQKLRLMGPVNLEAISEQDELEESIRFNTEQRDDLVEAQKSLDELITRLNKISRERFMQTFEEIRANFREIFRKVFGGGKADVFLELPEPAPQDAAAPIPPSSRDGGSAPQNADAATATPPAPEIDVLEAGIEIVASPPGKELKSIRQLSGGEKTMTTIALLFAIFKTKPSPFCILDEVDAALDETNIDRFASIVQEFLMDSQFVIITHSKRTLGIADVLYGITMEEQGVSKKVSVRLKQAANMVA